MLSAQRIRLRLRRDLAAGMQISRITAGRGDGRNTAHVDRVDPMRRHHCVPQELNTQTVNGGCCSVVT